MIEFSPHILALIVVVGVAAGFIDAIVGGGGLLTIPALLGIGLPPHLALGTNKLAASFGSLTAAFTFYKKNLLNPKLWWVCFLMTGIGAVLGSVTVHLIDKQWLEKVLPVIILMIAIYSICQPYLHKHTHSTLSLSTRTFSIKQLCQGLILGFYDGFAGPGTGAFWMASSMFLYRLKIMFCAALSKAMNFTSNFISLIMFIYLGHVNWIIGLTLGISITIGAIIGVYSAIHFGEHFIRPMFITIVIVIAGKLAWQAWI
ncbi:TSUP family transporter [Celerinatantimonas sp. YJH-8]|uniref:TSUP family transporter n=1 Tax=Celerinatantimonas sp. YJH-8 TaxID=3228714 RepID=UPI0038C5D08C